MAQKERFNFSTTGGEVVLESGFWHFAKGKRAGESCEQVRRLIYLTHLIPEICETEDNSVLKESGLPQMTLRPTLEPFRLTETEQRNLPETMSVENCALPRPGHQNVGIF